MKYLLYKQLVVGGYKIFQPSEFNTNQIPELGYYIHFPLSYCGEKLCAISDNTGGSVWGEM